MIAMDMDGTLLTNDKKISKENAAAIKMAQKSGVQIVLATGRPIDGIKSYLNELGLTSEKDYAIVFNGGIVQNVKTKNVISDKCLDMSAIDYLYPLSKKLDIDVHAFTKEHGLVAPKMNEYTELESTINKIPVNIMDFDDIDKNSTLIKFMMVGSEDKITQLMTKLPKEAFEKYTIVRSSKYFLEFLNKSCNKGEAIKSLANHLNINISDVICIGDAGNDYHMIKFAGLGVAMNNAFPEIKEIADFITKDNNDHGVAHVIKKFILNNN
jgi:Cof subfamily protein (haloacid dehalogenase superfamily)